MYLSNYQTVEGNGQAYRLISGYLILHDWYLNPGNIITNKKIKALTKIFSKFFIRFTMIFNG